MLLNFHNLEKQKLSDEMLESKIQDLVNKERALETEFLELLQQAENRKIYLSQGYSSLFEWLTQKFKYSEAAAARRVNTIKLIEVVPEIKDKMVDGTLNMTTLSKVQTVIRRQEKLSGQKVSTEIKADIIKSIENKSGAETEKTLLEIFPQAASQQERSHRIDDSHTRLSLVLDEEVLEKLKQVKDRLSHILPEGNFSDVVNYLADNYLKKDQKKTKPVNKDLAKLNSKVGELKASESAVHPVAAKPHNILADSKEVIDRATDSATAKVIDRAVDSLAEKLTNNAADSTAKRLTNNATDSAAAKRRVTPSLRKLVFQHSGNKCEFTYKGRRCNSSFQLEVDHIYPRSLGGEHELHNLRALCRRHNQFVAQRIL